jgi:hypothetical protein
MAPGEARQLSRGGQIDGREPPRTGAAGITLLQLGRLRSISLTAYRAAGRGLAIPMPAEAETVV